MHPQTLRQSNLCQGLRYLCLHLHPDDFAALLEQENDLKEVLAPLFVVKRKKADKSENVIARSAFCDEAIVSLNNVIIIASLVIFLFGFFQIAVALFYHKYYINSKRLDAEKSFREKLDLEKNERARIANDLHDGLQNDFVAIKNYVSLLASEEENQEKITYFNKLEASIDLANKNIKNIIFYLFSFFV